ncbi:MAG: YfiR family protein [Bryobacteraceae bacterium]
MSDAVPAVPARPVPGTGVTAPRRRRVFRAALTLVTLAVAGRTTLIGGTSATPPEDEFKLKAAFVLNFIRLVNWASVPGEQGDSRLTVCALGNSDFAAAVRATVTGKTAGNRPISFRFTPNPDPAQCRVLIVDSSQYPIAREALSAVQAAPVLTIGNGPGFLSLGGMFELVVEDRRVLFDAGLDAIRRARLDVSARLLQLSRNLRRGSDSAL